MITKSYRKRIRCCTKAEGYKPIHYVIKESNYNFIYLLFRAKDNKIMLVIEEEDNKYVENNDLQILSIKRGSKRELDLTKITLLELGHYYNQQTKTYDYSQRLLNHLNKLGFSTDSSNKKKKKFIIEFKYN